MSDPSNDLLARLSAAVERLSGQAAQQHAPPTPTATTTAAAWPNIAPAYPPQPYPPNGCYGPSPMPNGGPIPFMPLPKPIGVSVPVTVPLPDGRELSVRVEFGPEAADNLPATAAAAAQLFGQYLQARGGFNRGGYSGGAGGGYGYRNGGYRGYGYSNYRR